ncbi:MAG: hypothetical protein JW804_04545 [Sedimentisphaerales bacterium]|nr:hypothetical protein [Sedimentisphaerales bacterium]
MNLPDSAKLLPPETVFVIDVKDFGKLDANFKKTNFYRLYKDPQMAAFVEHAKAKWHEKIKEIDENNFLRALADAGIWPQGRLTMAFVDIESKDINETPMLFIAQWGTNVSKIKETVSKSMEKNIELGGHKTPDINFQGIKIETAVDEQKTPFGYCFIDDTFISGTSIEAIKFALAQIKGATSPTLADDNNYLNTAKAIGLQNDMTIYINISHLIKKELAKDAQGRLQTTFSNLGVDRIGGFGAALEMAPTPAEPYKVKALLKINGSKTGILKALEPKTSALNVPRFIPADTASVGLFNLDMKQSFDEMIKVLTMFNPSIASILYNPLTQPGSDGTPGLTVKADIIDHLSTGAVVIQLLNKPFSEKIPPSDYLVALATSNRNALEKSLAKLHEQMLAANDPEAKRELLGHTLYLIKTGSMPFMRSRGATPMQQENEQPGTPKIPNVAFTVTDTHVILGFEASVEKAVRTLKASESLKDKRWFNQARASIPSQTGIANFENTQATAEFLWWLLKKSKDNPAGAGMSAPTASYLIDDTDLDFSLLPEYEKVKDYFGTSTFSLISADDGFYMESGMINQL